MATEAGLWLDVLPIFRECGLSYDLTPAIYWLSRALGDWLTGRRCRSASVVAALSLSGAGRCNSGTEQGYYQQLVLTC